jgi:hypothetical protein
MERSRSRAFAGTSLAKVKQRGRTGDLPEGSMSVNTNLGELISTIYEQFLAQYGDEELASVATAAVINDLLSASRTRGEQDEAA